MLTPTDYTDARARGIRPAHIRRTIEQWNAWEAERDAGRVRIVAFVDPYHDPSDFEGFTVRSAEVNGVWGFVAQVRMHPSHEWDTVGSLWGIVLDDFPPLGSRVDEPGLEGYALELERFQAPSGSGCEEDLMHAALRELTLAGEGE